MSQLSIISLQYFFQIIILVKMIESSSNRVISHIDGCTKFDPHLFSIKKTYVLRHYRDNVISLPAPTSSMFNNLLENCNQTENESEFPDFKVNLRIQYHYAYSCIRIELDLGMNFTRLSNDFKFNYYMFSYREFTMPIFNLNQNPLNESINTLIINKINPTPYVVCLTFLKQKIDNSFNS
jgi:hypothetical protein